jgi:hypothetical protein
MTEKRKPVAERQREPGHDGWPLQLAVLDNRPDTGRKCPVAKAC